MNLNLETVLSLMPDGAKLSALFDLTHSPEARWTSLQSLIESSPKWRARVKWCLAMRQGGESDADILSWLIADLDLIGPFGVRINARLARSLLTPEQIRNYEEGFGWLLSKQEEYEAGKVKPVKQRKKPAKKGAAKKGRVKK